MTGGQHSTKVRSCARSREVFRDLNRDLDARRGHCRWRWHRCRRHRFQQRAPTSMKVVERCALMYRHVVMLTVLSLVLVAPLWEIQRAKMMEFHTWRVSSSVDYTNTRTERNCQRTIAFTHREHNFRGIDLLVTVVAIAGPSPVLYVFIVPPLRKNSLATLAVYRAAL